MARFGRAVLLVVWLVIIANTAAAQEPRFTSRIEEADALLFLSRYAEADAIYDEVIADDEAEADERAVALAHRCYSRLVRFLTEEAVADCRQAVATAPDEPEGYIYLTRALDWQGNLAEAIETGQKAVALGPQNALAYSFLGEAYIDAGANADGDLALMRSVELATDDSPYDGVIYRNLAVARYLAEDHEGFAEAAALATRLAPDFAPFREEFASYHAEIGRADLYVEELVAWAEILQRTGDAAGEATAWSYAANALYGLGRLDEAKAAYARLAELQSDGGDRAGAARSRAFVGFIESLQGDYAAADATLRGVIAEAESLGERGIAAQAMTTLGTTLKQRGDIEGAVSLYEQAQAIQEDIGDPIHLLTTLNELGHALVRLGEAERAIELHERALALAQANHYPNGELSTLIFLGTSYHDQGDYRRAAETFERALDLARQLGSKIDEATTLHNLGRVYGLLGENERAIEYLEQVLAMKRASGQRGDEAVSLAELGQVYVRIGQTRQGLETLEEALAINREIGNLLQEAETLTSLGAGYFQLADYDRARDSYMQALTIREGLGRDNEGASIRNNLGAVADALGDTERAIAHYQAALEIYRRLGNRAGEAYALGNQAMSYWRQGRYEEALRQLMETYALLEQSGDRSAMATALANLGTVYSSLGQPQEALTRYQDALAIQRETGNLSGQADALAALANSAQIHGDRATALEWYEEALSLFREIGAADAEATVLNNIAMIYYRDGDMAEAERFLLQALAIAQAIGDRQLESILLENLGGVRFNQGDADGAREQLDAAIAIEEEIGDRAGLASSLAVLGAVLAEGGDSDAAIEALGRAVDLRESLLAGLASDDLKASYAGLQVDVYAALIDLLLDAGRHEEAFETMERARARVLLDQLANGRVEFRAAADDDLLQQEVALRSEIRARREQLLQLRNRPVRDWDSGAIRAAQQELDGLEQSYSGLLTDLQRASPETADLVAVDVASVAEVQALLDEDTTLVEFFVTHAETQAHILTRSSYEVVRLPVGHGELLDSIERFRDFATLDDPHPRELRELYAALIEPLDGHLQTRGLVIVPHSVLHYLPFAALTDGEHYLSEAYAISVLPSASVLRFLGASDLREDRSLLALGNPATDAPLAGLPYAAKEVQTISQLFSGEALTNERATESMLRANGPSVNIIHLAAHGEFNAENPLFSALYLAPDDANDGRLEVHEIYGLDLTEAGDLVVLSACETQLGALSAGDEIVGLNRAFLYAGTPSVVASLWNVDDAATEQLMYAFYSNLWAGMGKAEALAASQNQLRQSYPHPYYWAAFVLTGDAGEISGLGFVEPPQPTATPERGAQAAVAADTVSTNTVGTNTVGRGTDAITATVVPSDAVESDMVESTAIESTTVESTEGTIDPAATPAPEVQAGPNVITVMALGVLVVAGIAGGFVYWRQKYGAARRNEQDGN